MAAWHIEWAFRCPPAVDSDEWHEVADEYFRRIEEMQPEMLDVRVQTDR